MKVKPEYQNLNESDLVSLLKAGEEGAFATLYHRHWAMVYQRIYRILRNEDETKDLVQEVFGNLWLRREQLAEDTNVGAYLYVQSRNRVFNLITKLQVRSDYLISISKFVDEAETNPGTLLEEKELLDRVEQQISQLPTRMREIFEMSRKENLSHREIAEKLGLSEQTVKKQVQNALKIIRPKLQKFGGIAILLFYR